VGGFYDHLEALADPKHDRHDELLEWGGPFDPEAFDAARATKEMRRGLPSWRDAMPGGTIVRETKFRRGGAQWRMR
jgi:hypothetical protein